MVSNNISRHSRNVLKALCLYERLRQTAAISRLELSALGSGLQLPPFCYDFILVSIVFPGIDITSSLTDHLQFQPGTSRLEVGPSLIVHLTYIYIRHHELAHTRIGYIVG